MASVGFGTGLFGGGLFGPATDPVPANIIDPVDSYYSWVKTQLGVYAPGQLLAGMANAQDWPQVPVMEEAPMLLFLNATPVGGTESQIMYQSLCQWVWLIIGTNIPASQQAANRGDRYRKDAQIRQNLRQANYPGFCPRLSYSADTDGNLITATIEQPVTPDSSGESIWWSRLQFMPKMDIKSGVVYGAASVRIYSYEDVAIEVA